MRGTQSIRRSSRSTANRYKTMTVANDATTKDAANTKQTLLPGCGRPLNYIPKKTDSDYIGKLFKNALSTVDIEGNEVACVFFCLQLHPITTLNGERVSGLGCL